MIELEQAAIEALAAAADSRIQLSCEQLLELIDAMFHDNKKGGPTCENCRFTVCGDDRRQAGML